MNISKPSGDMDISLNARDIQAIRKDEMKKRKFWKYALAVLGCILILVSNVGCNRIAEEKYKIQNYRTEADVSLYNVSPQFSEMENVVVTAMYKEDQILICQDLEDEGDVYRKIWLFSYLTGEKELCSNLKVSAGTDYQASAYRFSVLGTVPFVLCDRYESKIYIYKDDFSAYSTISLEEYAMPSGMFVRSSGFYFMDFDTCKVYRHEMTEFSDTEKEMDYKTFRETAQLIFTPDVQATSFQLEDVSADGNCLRFFAENLRDNEYYYYLYHVPDKEYKELYQLDYNASVCWSSWDGSKYLNEVVPSAVSRYEWIDYTESFRYTTKVEPQVVYSMVQCDTNIMDGQKYILFYVVDETTELITELFLWEYAKAESEVADVAPVKEYGELPVEIDYADLTDKAEVIEEKYNVNIVMGENVTCDFDAYEYEQVSDETMIADALEQLELALDAFPDGMCTELALDYASGFNIYLCGTFVPKDSENISDAGAFYTFENGCYNLAVDVTLGNTEANVIHEMTHAIDDYFFFCGASEQLEKDWSACNPNGFAYLNSYFGYEELSEYTCWDDYESVHDIYFVDAYSCTFPGEDRSRVFEYFGSETYKEDWLLDSEPLRRKAGVLLDYCSKYLECFRTDKIYGIKTKSEEVGW